MAAKKDPATDWKCTICDSDFNLESEGGTVGYIGILPVAFCPTCKSGIIDFAEQMTYHECEECGHINGEVD